MIGIFFLNSTYSLIADFCLQLLFIACLVVKAA